jgi:rhamnose transport system ATP-binding protein
MPQPLVTTTDLVKRYGAVCALDGVSLAIHAGEIHGLVGENGAGKSTLINLLSGAIAPTSGGIAIAGQPLIAGVRAAEAAGIAVIHQEPTAFPDLDALDNLFVGREPRRCAGLLLDRPRMRREAQALLGSLGVALEEGRPLVQRSYAQRQLVAITRALSLRSRLLILDEPTAALSQGECQALSAILRRLRSEGVAILHVSHRLEEVLDLADRVTVLRDGRCIGTRAAAGLDRAELIRAMVGREVEDPPVDGAPTAPGAVRLAVRGLTRAPYFHQVSFDLRAGEIVGLAGLVGAGRSRLAAAIFGLDRPDAGSVTLDGTTLPPGQVPAAVAAGLALVPEDRQRLGLVLPLGVGENLVLAALSSLARGGFRSFAREQALAQEQMRVLAVKAASPAVPAATLSGGNQQKLVLGKWLATAPAVLILDEPTRGIDAGARAEIHRLIRRLGADGLATLVISSDLEELLALGNRILVLRQGRLSGELARAEATPEKLLALAMPASPVGAAP